MKRYILTKVLLLFVMLGFTSLYGQSPAISPTDTQTGVTVSTNSFSWTDLAVGTNANSYNFELHTNSGYTSLLEAGQTFVTGTSASIGTGLSYNTTYYWRVQDSDNNDDGVDAGAGDDGAWVNFSFTTQLATPVQTAPIDGATVQLINPTLTWTMAASTTDIDYYVDYDLDGSTGGWDNTAGPFASPTTNLAGLDYNTTYYWQVRAVVNNGAAPNNGETTTSAEFTFTTEVAAPTLNSPLATFDESITPTLDYNYDIGGNANPITLYVEYRVVGAVSWTTATSGAAVTGNNQTYSFGSNLLYNTDYEWRVRVVNDNNGADTKSAASSFKTLLPTPALVQHIGGADVYDRTPTLTWSISGSTTTTDIVYDVWIDGAEVSSDQTATSYTPGANLDLGNHEWYVVIQDDNGAAASENADISLSGVFENFNVLPSLTTPVNGLTGVPILPQLQWEEGGSNLDYTIQITTVSGNYALSIDVTVDNTEYSSSGGIITYTLNAFDHANLPLSHNSLYYWRVYYNDGLNNYYSQEWHFTTVPVVTVTHTSPNNGGLVYTNTPTVYYYASTVTGTMKYQVQYVRDELLTTPGSAPTEAEWFNLSTSHITTSLNQTITVLAGKKYWWRVVVQNSGNFVIGFSVPWSFTVVGGTNISISQSWPVGNPTVYTYTPFVYWFSDQLALGVSYTVWYNTAGDTNFNGYIDGGDTGAFSVAAGSNINVQLPTLTGGTMYYWSVEALYNAESTYSGIASFTTYQAVPLVVPIATYPIGGMTIYTTAPFVYYYTASDVSGVYFDLDLATTSGGQDGNADFSTATPGLLYIQLTGLTPGQTYYYKLRSKSVAGVPGVGQASSWSSEYSFTVTGGINYGYPVLTWPIGGATVYTLRPTLYWYLEGSSLGLTGYTVKYTNNPAAAGWNSSTWNSFNPGFSVDNIDGEIVIGSINTTNYTFTADLDYATTYYWAVASTDGFTESTYAIGSFAVYGLASPYAPTLASPNNGTTITSRAPSLYWYIGGSTTGFVSYTLVYSTSDVFAAPVTTTVTGLTNSFYTMSNLTPGATYYWYVTAVYSQGNAISATWTFTVDPGALSVQPFIGGPNNVDVATGSPTLSWVIPVPSQSELSYQLEVSDNIDFVNAMVYDDLQTPSQIVEGLQDGNEYYWRVRSSTSSGDVSFYSGTAKFKVVSSNITDIDENEIVPTEFSVSQNYPNPFNPTTMINYSLPAASFVTVKIYDMLGREVNTLLSGEMPAGVHNVAWNGDNSFGAKVSSGTYIYRVVAGNNVVIRKMVLLK